MKARKPEAFAHGGAFFGGFQPADDAKYQVIRDLNETAKRLAAQKLGGRALTEILPIPHDMRYRKPQGSWPVPRCRNA
jgi:hypothetical protein